LGFEPGRAKVDLTAFAAQGIHDFDALSIETVGGNSVVHFDANNDLTLVRIEVA
jgi:hypothetical protein